jgi:hypothetical protein
MNDDEREVRDGFSARPSLLRALALSILLIVLFAVDGLSGPIGILSGLTTVAWLAHGRARARERSLGDRAG